MDKNKMRSFGIIGATRGDRIGRPSPPARRASDEIGSELARIRSKYGFDGHIEALYGDRGPRLRKGYVP